MADFFHRLLSEPCEIDDETGEELCSQPAPALLQPFSQVMPPSHEFILKICQPRSNGPIVKMLSKNKPPADAPGSIRCQGRNIRKTYRIIKQQKSPQSKCSPNDLLALLDSITSTALTTSSQPPSDIQLPFQLSLGAFQGDSEPPFPARDVPGSSAGDAACAPSASSPVVHRRLTPRSSHKAKQTCHRPSPSKLETGFNADLGPMLALEPSFERAAPVSETGFKENVSAAACNVPSVPDALACGQLFNPTVMRASTNQATAASSANTAACTPANRVPSERKPSSQLESSSKILPCHTSSQPLPNTLQGAAAGGAPAAAAAVSGISRPRRTAAKHSEQRLADLHSQSSSQGDSGATLSQGVRQMSVVDAFAAMRQSAHTAAASSGRISETFTGTMQLLCLHSTCDRRDHAARLHLHGVTAAGKNITAVVAGHLPCVYVRPARSSPHFALAAAVSSAAASSLPPLDALVSSLNRRLRPSSLSPASSSKDWRIARGISSAGAG
jgi:hypothetical protein